MGILPLATATDFITRCTIPTDPLAALQRALDGEPEAVDLVQASKRYVTNVASAAFSAAVATEIPFESKNYLAGGACSLSGMVKILNFPPMQYVLKQKIMLISGKP